jgi:hypothetical protein
VQVLRKGMNHLMIQWGGADMLGTWPEGTCGLPEEEERTWDMEAQRGTLGQGREEIRYGHTCKLLLPHLLNCPDSQGSWPACVAC